MSIVGTAAVPSNGNLMKVGTVELPAMTIPGRKVDAEVLDLATEITRKIAEGKIGRDQLEAAIQAAAALKPAMAEAAETPQPTPQPVDATVRLAAGEQLARKVWAIMQAVEYRSRHPESTITSAQLLAELTNAWDAYLDAAGSPYPDVEPTSKHASAGPAPSTVWPPTVCPKWCAEVDDPQGGHACDVGVDHPDDRRHLHDHYRCTGQSASNGEAGEVELTLEDPLSYPSERGQKWTHQRLYAERGQKWTHQRLYAELGQHYRETEPRIRLSHDTGDPEKPGSHVDMTVDEARQLAGLLTHFVDLADAGKSSRVEIPEHLLGGMYDRGWREGQRAYVDTRQEIADLADQSNTDRSRWAA